MTTENLKMYWKSNDFVVYGQPYIFLWNSNKSELKRKKYFMGQNSITLNLIMYHLSQNVSI